MAIRRAVFFPIPGMSEMRAMSLFWMASTSSSGVIPERTFIAIFGPIPETPMSLRKSSRSSSVVESEEDRALSVRWVWMKQLDGLAVLAQLEIRRQREWPPQ